MIINDGLIIESINFERSGRDSSESLCIHILMSLELEISKASLFCFPPLFTVKKCVVVQWKNTGSLPLLALTCINLEINGEEGKVKGVPCLDYDKLHCIIACQ